MPFLKVEGLTKSFGGLTAVHDLEFQVEEGEIIGLIGPNGSGKTTTLNLLTGFLKPDSGTITFRDMNVTGLPRHRMGPKGMARTFQLTKTFFDFTALQNVMVGRGYGR
jgi:ABC-type branched-subunit amino acid transport system ATPase component